MSLIVPSRNVLLTSSGWRGGFRNTSHDVTGPRPAGRIEEGQEGADRPTASGRGDWPKRTACAPLAEETERQGRRSAPTWLARPGSNRKLDAKIRQAALEILSQKIYSVFSPTLAAEYLADRHAIRAGRETVRTWMIEGKLGRAQRQTIEKNPGMATTPVAVGELVQWDTSEHAWLEERRSQLYLISMIDDASSRLHARFVLHDSTAENMRLLWSYLERHGRPVSYYTDKASLFQTTSKIAGALQKSKVTRSY
jgi:hypothetical protein